MSSPPAMAPTPPPIPTPREGSRLSQAISRLHPKQSGMLTTLLEKWEKCEVSKDTIRLFFPRDPKAFVFLWHLGAATSPISFTPICLVSLVAAGSVMEWRGPKARCRGQLRALTFSTYKRGSRAPWGHRRHPAPERLSQG